MRPSNIDGDPLQRLADDAAVLAIVVSVCFIGTAPTGAAPYCGITWGSLDKTGGVGAQGTVFDVRSGQHPCFDRLVIDVEHPAP